MPFKLVLGLDVGGVLIRTPWEIIKSDFPIIAQHEINILGPFSEGTDSQYLRLLAGSLSETEYWHSFRMEVRKRIKHLSKSEDPVRDLIINSDHPFRESIMGWLPTFVSKGGTVYTFSNGLFRILGKRWSELNMPNAVISQHFDASETGIRKPTREAFSPLVDAHNSGNLNRVVYMDDNPYYAAAAASCGIVGLWFSVVKEQASLELLSVYFDDYLSDEKELRNDMNLL